MHNEIDLFNHTQHAHSKIDWLVELFGAALRDARAGDENWTLASRVVEAAPAKSGKRDFLDASIKQLIS